MSFNLKPQQTGFSSDEPKVDYNAINEQVEADNTPALISLIVDLGVHTPPLNVSDRESTTFDTEEEAADMMRQVVEIKGEKDAEKYKVSVVDGKYVVNGNIYQPKDGQEVAIFADLVDNVVDYGDTGKHPYRIVLNKSWMGELKGFSLKVVPPQSGKIWTFAGNSMLTKLAKATKSDSIVDGSNADDLNNIGLLLGKALMVDVKKVVSGENTYINVGGVSSVPKLIADNIDKSLVTPVGISFDSVTVEDLENAKLRGNIIKKIKAANNFVGSKMEAAMIEFEGKTQQPQQQSQATQPTTFDDDDF